MLFSLLWFLNYFRFRSRCWSLNWFRLFNRLWSNLWNFLSRGILSMGWLRLSSYIPRRNNWVGIPLLFMTFSMCLFFVRIFFVSAYSVLLIFFVGVGRAAACLPTDFLEAELVALVEAELVALAGAGIDAFPPGWVVFKFDTCLSSGRVARVLLEKVFVRGFVWGVAVAVRKAAIMYVLVKGVK